MGTFKDLTGQTFGRLIVKSRAQNIVIRPNLQYACWVCLCECGSTTKVRTADLKSGHTQSCGCLLKERIIESKTIHGGSFERLYGSVWANMLQRCENPNNKYYKDYGGRGIVVCEEWRKYSSFKEWALRNGYDEKAKHMQYTVDRIDNDGNYEPQNCRIVNIKIQSRNTRANIFVSVNGHDECLFDLSQLLGISYETARNWYHKHNFRTYDEFSDRAISIRNGYKPHFQKNNY